MHHKNPSHAHHFGFDQVSLNLFFSFFWISAASFFAPRRKAGFRQVRSFPLLLPAPSLSSLSSLMCLALKMWPIVFYQALQGVLIHPRQEDALQTRGGGEIPQTPRAPLSPRSLTPRAVPWHIYLIPSRIPSWACPNSIPQTPGFVTQLSSSRSVRRQVSKLLICA